MLKATARLESLTRTPAHDIVLDPQEEASPQMIFARFLKVAEEAKKQGTMVEAGKQIWNASGYQFWRHTTYTPLSLEKLTLFVVCDEILCTSATEKKKANKIQKIIRRQVIAASESTRDHNHWREQFADIQIWFRPGGTISDLSSAIEEIVQKSAGDDPKQFKHFIVCTTSLRNDFAIFS